MRSLANVGVVVLGLAVAALYFLTGDRLVRWSDAYHALQATEVAYPSRGPEGERLRLAQAMVDGEPPQGLPPGPRLHPVGTLARLRYEAIARDGTVAGVTEVRALVPALPYFSVDAPGGPFGRLECPEACTRAVDRAAALRIDRGGTPGLADEWVLRMPVGTPFLLSPRSLQLRDLEDARPLSLPQARYRVTLLLACPARVRVGSLTGIDWYENAILPLPRGLRKRHWVQLEGCDVGTKPARAEPVARPPVHSAEAPAHAYRMPPLGVLAPRRDRPMGQAILAVDEQAALNDRSVLHVRLLAVCRYDPRRNAWDAFPVPDEALEISGPGLMNRTRVALRFHEGAGLNYARWTEMRAGEPSTTRTYSAVVPSGADVTCREADLPVPGPGQIATCVPRNGPTLPGVVPDPERACGATEAAIATPSR